MTLENKFKISLHRRKGLNSVFPLRVLTVSTLPSRFFRSKMNGFTTPTSTTRTGFAMLLHGFIMSAELAENPPGSERIELLLRIQGVGPGQPRRIIVPYAYLLADPSLDADDLTGRGFEAEVEPAGPSRWEVVRLGLAGRVLRSND